MFIGREKELLSLNKLYGRSGFGMAVVYGRRHIGKTALLAEFIRDKKAIYYAAANVGKERNRELFAAEAVSVLEPGREDAAFSSLETLFDFIGGKLDEKLVIVIDELPYWAGKDEELFALLRKYMDTAWTGKALKLILCGAAFDFMEERVLGVKSPLFGKREVQIRLEPFSYEEAALFVPDYSCEDKAVCYGITGGVAKYLALLDPSVSLDENIKRLFFDRDGALYDGTRKLLAQEFSDTGTVERILEQMALGANTVNVIAERSGEKEQKVLYYMEKLAGLGLVGKTHCITEEKNRKKTRYLLHDHMFRFWYAFIPGARSAIERGAGEAYYEEMVKPQLHAFMGGVFEEMCRYYVLKQSVRGKLAINATQVGGWWGIADIDVVAVSDADKTAVIGECSFREEKMDKGVYEALTGRADVIAGRYWVTKLMFFSLGGFSKWFLELNRDDVVLVTLEDMYKISTTY